MLQLQLSPIGSDFGLNCQLPYNNFLLRFGDFEFLISLHIGNNHFLFELALILAIISWVSITQQSMMHSSETKSPRVTDISEVVEEIYAFLNFCDSALDSQIVLSLDVEDFLLVLDV